MKGCARTCLLWIVGWAAAAAAFYYYFQGLGVIEPGIWWASVGAGLCVVIVIAYLLGIIERLRERSMLLEAAMGAIPADGKWVAVSGTIRSLNPLRGPFSGAPVATYTYKISRMERSGKSSSEVTYYDGKALASSTIATRTGAIRLLAVPTLEVKGELLDYRTAIQHAREYVSTTPFQTSSTPKAEKIGVTEESTDDDGVFRVDSKYFSERDVDVGDCQLTELHIKQGEPVCAFGLYSQARHGLIPHPNWARQTRIMRGDANTVAAQLRKKAIGYAIGTLFFSGAVVGIVKLYQHFAALAS